MELDGPGSPATAGHARARASCGIDVTHRHHRQPRPRQSAPLTQSCENAEVHGIGGLGGTWLLNTIGGSLEKQGRADNVSVVFAVWAAVVLKVIAAVVPLVALRRQISPAWDRTMWLLAWIEAGILTIYGLALTAVGLLVQAGAIHASATADHRALAWHAYLWDPWFLIWGLLVAGSLRRGRYPRHQAAAHS